MITFRELMIGTVAVIALIFGMLELSNSTALKQQLATIEQPSNDDVNEYIAEIELQNKRNKEIIKAMDMGASYDQAVAIVDNADEYQVNPKY